MAQPLTPLTPLDRPRGLRIAAGMLAIAAAVCISILALRPPSDLLLNVAPWIALGILLVMWVAVRRLVRTGQHHGVSTPIIVAGLSTYAWLRVPLAGDVISYLGLGMFLAFLGAGVLSVYVWLRHPYARTRAALCAALIGAFVGLALGAWLPGIRSMVLFSHSAIGQFAAGLLSAYLGAITLHAWAVGIGDEIRRSAADATPRGRGTDASAVRSAS